MSVSIQLFRDPLLNPFQAICIFAWVWHPGFHTIHTGAKTLPINLRLRCPEPENTLSSHIRCFHAPFGSQKLLAMVSPGSFDWETSMMSFASFCPCCPSDVGLWRLLANNERPYLPAEAMNASTSPSSSPPATWHHQRKVDMGYTHPSHGLWWMQGTCVGNHLPSLGGHPAPSNPNRRPPSLGNFSLSKQ